MKDNFTRNEVRVIVEAICIDWKANPYTLDNDREEVRARLDKFFKELDRPTSAVEQSILDGLKANGVDVSKMSPLEIVVLNDLLNVARDLSKRKKPLKEVEDG